MQQSLEVVACPEPGCTAPAEVRERYTLRAAGTPAQSAVPHVITTCLLGHRITTTED